MGKKRTNRLNTLYGLLVLVVILQAVAIGLVIRFEGGRETRDLALLDRTALMLNDIFPGIRSDLSAISDKTTEIKNDVNGIHNNLAKVDERVGVVGEKVAGIDGKVDALNQKASTFFQDKSGLIWGHSVNPYVLGFLLVLVLVSIPVWGWVWARKRNSPAPALQGLEVAKRATSEGLPVTTKASVFDAANRYTEAGPELRRIMDETERLINHVRHDEENFCGKLKPDKEICRGNSELLN